jgi:branched-chain amino acid transport system substrate-binding protein
MTKRRNDPPNSPKTPKKWGRRGFLKGTLAAGGAIAANIPLIKIARAADANMIRIGYVDLLTGPRAAFGEAGPWMLERIRARLKGGLKIGGKTYAVEILSRDSQSDVNRTASLGNELVLRENVDLVLNMDGLSAPLREICDANGTPCINTLQQWEPFYGAGGSTPDKGFPWNFLFFWSAGEIAKNYVGMWDTVKTNKVVGSFYVDNETGQSLMAPITATLKATGYTEVPGGLFKIDADDFSNQVATFKSSKAQILTGLVYAPHFATFWGQAQQAGLKLEVITLAAAFLFPSGVNVLGPDKGDGMSTEIWFTPNWPYRSSLTGQSAKQICADYEKSSGKQWTQPLGYNHAVWEVALKALTESGDPKNRNAVRHAIQNLNLETVVGKVDFKNSKLKNVAATELAAGQWRKAKGGKFPYELLVTYNGTAPNIPTQSKFELLSSLQT